MLVLKETCVEKPSVMVGKKKETEPTKTGHLIFAKFTKILLKVQRLPNSLNELFLRI